jgi:hypothetical protein
MTVSPIAGRGILSTSSFHVPSVSHIPKLTMQLLSAGQITDHGCHIILKADSCCVQDLHMGLLVRVGLGIMILWAFRSLTGCVSVRPLCASHRCHPVHLPPRQLHCLPLLLCSGIIV